MHVGEFINGVFVGPQILGKKWGRALFEKADFETRLNIYRIAESDNRETVIEDWSLVL